MVKKKAISPVVATALLLVVAVVAVIGFQTWFNTYQSGVNTKVEQQSNIDAVLSIERLVNGTVWIKNGGTDAVSISSIAVNGCTVSTPGAAAATNITSYTLTGCTVTTGTAYDVVVVTTEGVYQEEQITR